MLLYHDIFAYIFSCFFFFFFFFFSSRRRHTRLVSDWSSDVCSSDLLEIAKAACGFGMRVSAIRKHLDRPKPDFVEEVLPAGQIGHLLASSDVIVLSAPLTPETHQLIGPDTLPHVKRGAFLINIGRGN